HEGGGRLLDRRRRGGLSSDKCQAPDPCPIAHSIRAVRADASDLRGLDVEVEPVGRNGQMDRRLRTDKRDAIAPGDPGIGPTHSDKASLVGSKFPKSSWGQPGG